MTIDISGIVVPPAARVLLDFIGDTEAPKGYETIYGNNQGKLAKPLTAMTLDEVIDAGRTWSRRFGSSAAGRYQFMRATLRDLKAAHGLDGNQVFDPAFQDFLGLLLLKRRGFYYFIEGRVGVGPFGNELAKEWASFPVLVATTGQNGPVRRGDCFYKGDGVNKVLTTPEKVELTLIAARAANRPALPPDVPAPEPDATLPVIEEHEEALAPPMPDDRYHTSRGILGWAIFAIVVVLAVMTGAKYFMGA